jgi:hypothetical protein
LVGAGVKGVSPRRGLIKLAVKTADIEINPASTCPVAVNLFAPERGAFFIYALWALLVGALAHRKVGRIIFNGEFSVRQEPTCAGELPGACPCKGRAPGSIRPAF